LSATRAAATITGATVVGNWLASCALTFTPGHEPRPGSYLFDMAEIAGHGSTGSTILILQTVMVPLALAPGLSTVVVRGGTRQEWVPAFDDFANAYLPVLRKMGLRADAELIRWGWYPAGDGQVLCITPGARGAEFHLLDFHVEHDVNVILLLICRKA
jgi:RNA 3'-terminal phosphate cyclase (ATP)